MTESIAQALQRRIKFSKKDLQGAETRIEDLTHQTAMAIITVVVKKAELKALEDELAKAPKERKEAKK